jgi:pectate lyase
MPIEIFMPRTSPGAPQPAGHFGSRSFQQQTRRAKAFQHGARTLALLSALLGVAASASEPQMVAFPGAEGHGKMAQGGRGGRIIQVTSLEDSGPGTLRECIEATGARNCVFRVSGIIRLKSSLVIGDDSNSVSILGQTAPGGGILLTIDQTNDELRHTPLVAKQTHDVIVRHLRIRPRLPNSVKNVHAAVIENSQRVYFDHTSMSWATDENVSTYSNTTDITIANSIFAEGLNKHSKCTLLGADPRVPQNITFWRNACISNNDRNPDNNHYGKSCIEIVNNVFFNARSEWGEVFSQYPGGTPISYVGNYFKAGPSTVEKTYAIKWQNVESAGQPQIYESGNVLWAPPSKSLQLLSPGTDQFVVNRPPCPLAVDTLLAAGEAYEEVRGQSGAFPRDDLDVAWIKDMGAQGERGAGRMVVAPGEIPAIKEAHAYGDEDFDGMADSVEEKFGGVVGVNDAWEPASTDGSMRFDQFMEWLSQERIAGRYPK